MGKSSTIEIKRQKAGGFDGLLRRHAMDIWLYCYNKRLGTAKSLRCP